MALSYTKHESISLRKHPDFTEVWLHDRIAQDSEILGLGELDVIERERVQLAGGRLDMLLADMENNIRYEVEIMLGATDPSHIIRCIEYWDIERRRYPAYDHVAVLVAEEVTTRFLNVMSLLAGSIPLIAIQLNALRVGEHIVLDFVKVLDQRQLRVDDTNIEDPEEVGRDTWVNRVGSAHLLICDQIEQIANDKADPKLELKYKKRHIGLCGSGQFFNVIALFPKKNYVPMRMMISDAEVRLPRLEQAGLDAEIKKNGRLSLHLRPQDLTHHRDLLTELVHQAVKEHQE